MNDMARAQGACEEQEKRQAEGQMCQIYTKEFTTMGLTVLEQS